MEYLLVQTGFVLDTEKKNLRHNAKKEKHYTLFM